MRELLREPIERICIFSRDEHKQHEMQQAIEDPERRLRYFLGDVRDRSRLDRALSHVQYVIHAAALKHVSAAEFNPFECVQTNVMGTQNVLEACIDADVSGALLISTDKAVNPTTLYGATKLCAERLFLAAGAYAGATPVKFGVIRLGNIAFSRGSVIPKWLGLIARGVRRVPVTDPECTRYWITAEDAARAVLLRLRAMLGGECVRPAMPAYRLGDLALAMGVEMEITGLGPGERLHEDGSENAPRMTLGQLREEIFE